jgi:hypothetical protein
MNLLTPIATFTVALQAFGGGIQFPSKASAIAKSPDGKWSVSCKSPADDQTESGHVLLLRNKRTSIELRRFERSCDVLWSPDSSHLTLTDWLGSNLSDVLISPATNPTRGQSVRDLFPSAAIPEAELKGHCYFEATQWVDARHLRIRVFGHTDEVRGHSFEHKYAFDLRSRGFEQDRKKLPNQPHSANSRPGAHVRFGSWQMAAVADAQRWAAMAPPQ